MGEAQRGSVRVDGSLLGKRKEESMRSVFGRTIESWEFVVRRWGSRFLATAKNRLGTRGGKKAKIIGLLMSANITPWPSLGEGVLYEFNGKVEQRQKCAI